jgi:hypothetical protein
MVLSLPVQLVFPANTLAYFSVASARDRAVSEKVVDLSGFMQHGQVQNIKQEPTSKQLVCFYHSHSVLLVCGYFNKVGHLPVYKQSIR